MTIAADTQVSPDCPPLEIRTSSATGRAYHASKPLAAGTCLLDISTPYAYTIYKQFRNEVCAECWRYERGRRGFLTYREYGEAAGLYFCDRNCAETWISREGTEVIQLLKILGGARRRKEKTMPEFDERKTVTVEEIEQAWAEVARRENDVRELRKWSEIQLDEFETDVARYVLIALAHLVRESSSCSRQDFASVTDRGQPPTEEARLEPLTFGKATWMSFAALQPNEQQHLNAFPELLDNYVRIYQFLKAKFRTSLKSARKGVHDVSVSNQQPNKPSRSRGDGPPPTQNAQDNERHGREFMSGVADAITVGHVRTALAVDPGNSFGIWEAPLTEESECLGFAVYPVPSFFNHHCSPNVRKEWSGRSLRFVTTRSVQVGEELCISYGHVESMKWRERRNELREGWFFECECGRCTLERDEKQNEGSSEGAE